jgi:8-oxo-dGTP pyrophosphatase MutT (NUDIX family)
MSGLSPRVSGDAEPGVAQVTVDQPPIWFGWHEEARRLTAEEVRRRCAAFGPHGRGRLGVAIDSPRPSALLVPVTSLDGEAAVVVTKRPATMLHHQNDWVFPGGRLDPQRDANTLDTALREGSEELGAPRERIEVLRRLTTQGPIVTGFIIDVYVAMVSLADLSPDPGEVADWAVLPISALTATERYRRGGAAPAHNPGPTVSPIPLPPTGRTGGMHFFKIREDEELWGTQGEVLHELLDWLFRHNPVVGEGH